MSEVIMNATKKLTLKTIGVQDVASKFGANAKLGNVKAGEKILLTRMYGICIGYKVVESDMGQSNKLIGEFEGVRVSDGALFSSNVCYLPGGLDTGILIQLSQGASSVSFAFDIYAEPDLDARSARGYKYVGATAVTPAENDPLAQLRKGLLSPGAGQKEIAAPKADGSKDEKSTTTKDKGNKGKAA